MKEKKLPTRMCMICREKYPKNQLLRIVKGKDNNISLDISQKKEGRGCYICLKSQCLDKFIKSKALNRTYKMNIPLEIYTKIKGEIEEFGRTKK